MIQPARIAASQAKTSMSLRRNRPSFRIHGCIGHSSPCAHFVLSCTGETRPRAGGRRLAGRHSRSNPGDMRAEPVAPLISRLRAPSPPSGTAARAPPNCRTLSWLARPPTRPETLGEGSGGRASCRYVLDGRGKSQRLQASKGTPRGHPLLHRSHQQRRLLHAGIASWPGWSPFSLPAGVAEQDAVTLVILPEPMKGFVRRKAQEPSPRQEVAHLVDVIDDRRSWLCSPLLRHRQFLFLAFSAPAASGRVGSDCEHTGVGAQGLAKVNPRLTFRAPDASGSGIPHGRSLQSSENSVLGIEDWTGAD